jgi:nucleoside-diphosphate-sugar epimerase
MQVTGRKVLITGATGFIGSHVARRLMEQKGAQVRALARNLAKAEWLAKLGAELVPGELGDRDAVRRAVDGCAAVVHAAAQVSSVPQRETFVRTNVEGTENLVRAAVEAGAERFVHLSSVAVFGLPRSGEITDESPRRHCGDSYSDTKLDAEETVFRSMSQHGLPAVILRPSAVYGPGSTHWTVVPIKRIRKGKMFVVNRGRGTLNYVYIDNLVDAVCLVLEDDRAVGEAFIVNDGTATWAEFFGSLAQMCGKKGIPSVPLWMAKIWVRFRNLQAFLRGETTRVPPNALAFLVGAPIYRQTNLERKLGYRSRVPLEEGLRRTEGWLREAGLIDRHL